MVILPKHLKRQKQTHTHTYTGEETLAVAVSICAKPLMIYETTSTSHSAMKTILISERISTI
jgi:hypothetical protein